MLFFCFDLDGIHEYDMRLDYISDVLIEQVFIAGRNVFVYTIGHTICQKTQACIGSVISKIKNSFSLYKQELKEANLFM